jgi:hypothetical protein
MRSRRLLAEARAAERAAVERRIEAEKDATEAVNACGRLAGDIVSLRELLAGFIVAAHTPANAGATAGEMADSLTDALQAEGFDLALEFAAIDRRRDAEAIADA